MPIVYANIPQSIYCSRLTHLPSCLGFFYTGDPDVIRHAAQPTNNRRRLQQPGRRDYNQLRLVYPANRGCVICQKGAINSV